jgi:hypothetical protein
VSMTGNIDRVEVITSVQQRRHVGSAAAVLVGGRENTDCAGDLRTGAAAGIELPPSKHLVWCDPVPLRPLHSLASGRFQHPPALRAALELRGDG